MSNYHTYNSNRLSAEPGNFNFVAEVKRNKIRRNIKEILLSMYKLCFPWTGSVLILRGLCKTAQGVQKRDFFVQTQRNLREK